MVVNMVYNGVKSSQKCLLIINTFGLFSLYAVVLHIEYWFIKQSIAHMCVCVSMYGHYIEYA